MIYTNSLPTGNSFKSKVGLTFGFLTVEKFNGLDTNGKSTYLCRCECGETVLKSTGNLRKNNAVKYSCGCKMNSEKKLTISEMIDKVSELSDYEIIEANVRWDSTWILSCELHGHFPIRFSSASTGNSKCPSCRQFGFNVQKQAMFYVNSVELDGIVVAYKFGITGQTIEARISQIARNSKYSLKNIFNLELEGSDALELEKLFKNNLITHYLNKTDVGSGYTETVHPVQIIKIYQILKSITKD